MLRGVGRRDRLLRGFAPCSGEGVVLAVESEVREGVHDIRNGFGGGSVPFLAGGVKMGLTPGASVPSHLRCKC